MNLLPNISVVLPVYNAEKYIDKAINSILNQTYTDFEFIIINDGSTDSSDQIIQSFSDPRIIYIKNETNSGLISTLNKGIKLSKGNYVARMDSDDIALPDRFLKQVAFLEKNPDIGVIGCNSIAIDSQSNQIGEVIYPENNEAIKNKMIAICPFGHYSVIIRKSVLIESSLLYSTKFQHAEDYALWVELTSFTKFHNLQECLMYYRSHETSVSVKYKETQRKNRNLIRENYLRKILGTNAFDSFYNHNYKDRVEIFVKHRKINIKKYQNYKSQLLELMYLDALEEVEINGLKIIFYFSKLSFDKRLIFILKHYIKTKVHLN